MADDLDDGEFWLPSQFLTDDDILMDFKSDGSDFGFGSGSSSDLVSLTTETETSDDDDLLLSVLTRQFPGSKHRLSGSPQSTLCGWGLTQQGSSKDSPTGPVSPPKEPVKEETDRKKDVGGADIATLDLLNKAAGEVAKMKLRSENQRSYGTAFFDCSTNAKRLFYPPQPQQQPPLLTSPFYPPRPQFRRFPPHMMWGPVQLPPPPQQRQIHNRVTNAAAATPTNNGNTHNRPLGLPPSAWPPLPGQAQPEAPQPTKAQAQPLQPPAQPMMGLFAGPPQSVSVGTGVFLPRQVTTTVATKPKKKSEGNVMKTKNNKNSQRRNSRLTKANDDEIQLPSEWVY